jgi:probable rRNA maturation factor
LRADALAALHLAGLEWCELSLMLVDDGRIRVLNRDFRGKDESTDVLSFPQLDDATDDVQPGRGRARRRRARPRPGCIGGRAGAAGDSRPPLLLGDIVISVDTARRQSHALGVATAVRIRTFLIHGLLHLLGYDHERSQAEARRMFARERELAARLAEAQEEPPPGWAAAPPARGAWPPAAMSHEADARPVPRGTSRASARQVPVSPGKFRVRRKHPPRDDGSR